MAKITKKSLLKVPVEHVDIAKIDSTDLIEAMGKMSFTSRDLARAADIYDEMMRDKGCMIILTLAGSTSSAGCMQLYADLVRSEERRVGKECRSRWSPYH